MTQAHRGVVREAAIGVVALLGLLVLRLALGSAGGASARAGLALDAAAALAVWFAARASTRKARDARSRRAWLALTAYPLAWVVAPVTWLLGWPEALADVARALAMALAAASWLFAARAGDRWSRMRLVLDGALAAATAFVLGWGTVVPAVWAQSGGGAQGFAAVTLPLVAIWLAVLGFGMTWTELRNRSRLMPTLFVLALLVIAVSDVRWALGSSPVWAVAWGLYWIAVRGYGGTSPRAAVVITHITLTYEPYVLVLPTAAVLVVGVARGTGAAEPAVMGAAAVLVLLVVRQHVVSMESRALLIRLETTERLLRHQATHDHLTGLPGRVVLWERLEAASAERGTVGIPVAVAFVDLDGFKDVNDVHGHASGDAVLVEVARRLGAAIGAHGDDALAVRMSGDEFAVLLLRRAAREALDLAHAIHDALRVPMAVNGVEVLVTGSVGLASAPEGELNPSALLRAADVAMYRAKRAGNAGVEVAAAERG
ncbi:GGDEF domain-containing protein [Isoptericola sp. b441]|uniref:GGDEF domain-containing protein n=1 Tax=Actinotalea lenta TaxID=3064654 RepID=A0ABT9D521_9CELL|nr:GGDEF domain-containing protein [Isoptericola sp. b441]MDO8105839.1 GGDEF domain-containing protein [Isoptericola sp. b441]